MTITKTFGFFKLTLHQVGTLRKDVYTVIRTNTPRVTYVKGKESPQGKTKLPVVTHVGGHCRHM